MRVTVLGLVLAVVGSTVAASQEAPETSAPAHRTLGLRLEQLYLPGYEPAHQLRLALWDSPMSRLELAVAGEQWALRHPGPAGMVVPPQQLHIPLRLSFDSAAQPLVMGPWSQGWDQLTWQEKVAAGAQTGYIFLALIQIARHLR